MSDQNVFPEWRSFLGSPDGEDESTFIKFVVKRSGQVERYDRSKIEAAIAKALRAVSGVADKDTVGVLTDSVEERLRLMLAGRHRNSIPAIEEIQDVVETILVESKEVEVAKAYILYRARHEVLRDTKTLLLDINTTMDGYLAQADWRVKENANVNYSLGGLILHNSGSITANYWLKNIYPEEIAQAHRSADFHIMTFPCFPVTARDGPSVP